MGMGDSATQPESNNAAVKQDDGALLDRPHNFKSPIMPIHSEDLSEQILRDV